MDLNGPKVESAGIHHKPTPGPSGSEFLYDHIWVTVSWLVTHPWWGCNGLPFRALMAVRRKDLKVLENIRRATWSFRTKWELATELVEWCIVLLKTWFQKRVIVDGAYAKRPFLNRILKAGVVVISRLRRDAALYDLPESVKRRGKRRSRKYGNRLSLTHRGGHRKGWTKTLRKQVLQTTFFAISQPRRAARKIQRLFNALTRLPTSLMHFKESAEHPVVPNIDFFDREPCIVVAVRTVCCRRHA